MNILVSSINFHPDHSGIALYATDLPVYLAERGHEVTMVTGFSYYPSWLKRPSDRGALFRREEYRGVKILRGYLYVPRVATTARRVLHDLSFALFAAANFLRAGRHEVIVVLTPPLLLGLVGVLFRKLWRARLIIHIQDLQLDAAVSLGMLRGSRMVAILDRIERRLYRGADLVVAITPGMAEAARGKGATTDRTLVVHNWIDVRDVAGRGRSGAFLARLPQLRGKFLVAYAGNLGVKQGVDVLLDLAEATRDRLDIHFLVIGEGADRARLVDLASRKRLANLGFYPFLAEEQYYDMLRDIDLAFVSQRAATGNVFFPSKLLGIMALSRPMLVSADLDSELARFVSQSACGAVAAAGDVDSLQRHLLHYRENPEALAMAGRASREAVARFDREETLAGYLSRILKTARD
ncbi:MAG: WcaI family glycosyltransferase [Candidatus Binatia bacterium]